MFAVTINAKSKLKMSSKLEQFRKSRR